MPDWIDVAALKVVNEWIEHDLDEPLCSDYVATLQPELLTERIADFIRARVPKLEGLDRATEELCRRVEDGRDLIDEGNYDYARAFDMVEKQVIRIRAITKQT